MPNNKVSIRTMTLMELEGIKKSLQSTIKYHIREYNLRMKASPEDIFQETLLRAIEAENRGIEISDMRSFLKGIIKKVSQELNRKHNRFKLLDDGSMVLDTYISSEETTATLEEIELVNKIFHAIKKEEFDLLFLKEAEGYSWPEVTEKMGGNLKVDAAKQRAHRTRQRVKKLFNKEGSDMYGS
jgi:DNA-directed RNA polymerase specialized sigma24 family protein